MIVLLLRAFELGVVFPNNFPSFTKTEEEKEKLFYGLRILCYCMGVQEQFNLFSWPTKDIEHIARYDFWTDMYPAIINRDNLHKIKANTMNQEFSDKKYNKFFCYLWENEVYYMADVVKADKSVLGEKKKLNGYLFFKNILIVNLPNSLAIFLIQLFIKYKEFFINTYKTLKI